MKKVAVLYSKYNSTIDAIKLRLPDAEVSCFQDIITDDKLAEYDLIVLCNYTKSVNFNALNIHHSLLPAFAGENPEQQAILAGVKVTGISIFYTKPEKIIAQYPLFIENETHFDELETQMNNLEQILYPLIIEKILKNEQFEIKDLIKSSTNKKCCGSCNNCGGC